MDLKAESLKKHGEWNGKIEVVSRVPVTNAEELSLAYTRKKNSQALRINQIKDRYVANKMRIKCPHENNLQNEIGNTDDQISF